MTAPEQRGWWYRATREQKLAQIDAAIEFGMTAKQVAMNCGCYREQVPHGGSTVQQFARNNDRHFAVDYDKKAAAGDKTWVKRRASQSLAAVKHAYLAGEPVDMWAVE